MHLQKYVLSFSYNAVVFLRFRCEDPQNQVNIFMNQNEPFLIAYTTLEVMASTIYLHAHSARPVMIGFNFHCVNSHKVKLVQPTFTYWEEPQNMAVGDLAFYYTLYLCWGYSIWGHSGGF